MVTICNAYEKGIRELEGSANEIGSTTTQLQYELENAVDPSVIKKGQDKLDKIFKPIKDLDAEGKANIGNGVITKRVADDKMALKVGDPEKGGVIPIGAKLSTALGDEQVKAAIGAMSPTDYAETRDWITHAFGGDHARQVEQVRKTELYNTLQKSLPSYVKLQLEDIMGKGILANGDVEALGAIRFKLDKILQIKNSAVYNTLGTADRQLNTFDKIDHALFKMGEAAKTDADAEEAMKFAREALTDYDKLPAEVQQQTNDAYRVLRNAENKERTATWGDLDAATKKIDVAKENYATKVTKQSTMDDAVDLANRTADAYDAEKAYGIADSIRGLGRNATPEAIAEKVAIGKSRANAEILASMDRAERNAANTERAARQLKADEAIALTEKYAAIYKEDKPEIATAISSLGQNATEERIQTTIRAGLNRLNDRNLADAYRTEQRGRQVTLDEEKATKQLKTDSEKALQEQYATQYRKTKPEIANAITRMKTEDITVEKIQATIDETSKKLTRTEASDAYVASRTAKEEKALKEIEENRSLGEGGMKVANSLSPEGQSKLTHQIEVMTSMENKEGKYTMSQGQEAAAQIMRRSETEQKLGILSAKATELQTTIHEANLQMPQWVDGFLSTVEKTPELNHEGKLASLERDVTREHVLEPMRADVRQKPFFDQYYRGNALKTENDIIKASDKLDEYAMTETRARTILNADTDTGRIPAGMRGTLERGLQNPKSLDATQLDRAEAMLTSMTDEDKTILDAINARDREIPTSTKNALTDQIEATKTGKKIDTQLTERANRQADIMENHDTSTLTSENMATEYTALKKDLGEDGAAKIIGKYFSDTIDEIEIKGIPLTKKQQTLIGEIEDGISLDKVPIDKTTVEEFEELANNINWGESRKTLERLRTVGPLGYVDKTTIWKGMIKAGVVPTKSGTGLLKFALIGLPAYFYAASFMEQQAFEAAFQFGSFGKEKDSADTLLSKYFGKDAIQNTFFAAHDNLVKFYNMMGGIPYYGAYFTAITSAGFASVAAHDGNLKDIYNHMVSRGLATPDSSRLGYRETTEEERSDFYKENETSLFKNDADWMLKYGKMIYGDDTTIGPDGRPLSSTQMMALYHTYKADGKVSYDAMGKLSLTGRSDNWQKTDQTFVEAVLKYGDEKTKSWKKTTSSTPAAKGTGETSETDLMELAVKNAMKRDGVTEIIARKNTEDEVNYLMERDGSTKQEALEKLTGKVSGSTTSGTTTTSSSGGETSTSQLPTDEVSKYYQGLKFSHATPAEKKNIALANTNTDGTPNLVAARKTDPETSMTQFAEASGNKQGTVKTFVKETFMTMGTNDKKDLDEASSIDEKATANAIMEAAEKNCTGE